MLGKEKKKGISIEAAQDQVDQLVEFYYINKDKDTFKDVLPDLLDRISQGLVEVTFNNEGDPVMTQFLTRDYNDVKELKYNIIGGTAKTQIPNNAKSDHAKLYALIASLTEWSPTSIKKLKGVDCSVAETIGAFFLAI